MVSYVEKFIGAYKERVKENNIPYNIILAMGLVKYVSARLGDEKRRIFLGELEERLKNPKDIDEFTLLGVVGRTKSKYNL